MRTDRSGTQKVFDHCLSHYPRARMDGHSGSENDDALPSDAEDIPNLYSSDEDGDEQIRGPNMHSLRAN